MSWIATSQLLFDHVSHNVILDAMEVMRVPLVLVAAWVGDYMGPKH